MDPIATARRRSLSRRRIVAAAIVALASAPGLASDPAAFAVQQHLLQRQQLQDDLRLRMQQDQARSQFPRLDARGEQQLRQIEVDQRSRMQQLQHEQLQQSLRVESGLQSQPEAVQQSLRDANLLRLERERQEALQRSARELENARIGATKSAPPPAVRGPGPEM